MSQFPSILSFFLLLLALYLQVTEGEKQFLNVHSPSSATESARIYYIKGIGDNSHYLETFSLVNTTNPQYDKLVTILGDGSFVVWKDIIYWTDSVKNRLSSMPLTGGPETILDTYENANPSGLYSPKL